MSRKPIDEKIVAAVAELYPTLKSGLKIARKLGLALSTTYRAMHKAGIELPGRHSAELQEQKRKLKGDRAARAAADYALGLNLQDLARKYGVSEGTIRSAVRTAGIPLRPRGSQRRVFTDHEKALIRSLYIDERWSQERIAARVDSSQIVISRFLKSEGIETRGANATGKDAGGWKGGRIVNSQGYVRIYVDASDPMHSMGDNSGYVLEHRLVMARFLGRPLTKNETVHHIDGNTQHNEIENLQLRRGHHGKGMRLKCSKCGSFDIVEVALD